MNAIGSDPIQQIARQVNADGLRAIVESMPALLWQWADAGIDADQIGRRLTAINDAVTRRLIELHMGEHGPAPVPFCWLGFGSQARCEQLIGADQDNGLLISNAMADADRDWFERLANTVSDGLHATGFVYCPGKVMATTDAWRQTLDGWKRTIEHWARSPTSDAVVQASICFDLRAVYGDVELCRQMQRHLHEVTSRNTIFLAALAANVLESPVPLGLFNRVVVARKGEQRGTLDLKKRGMMPIIDIVRIHALANQIADVNTSDRLEELARGHYLANRDCRKLRDALGLIMQLRVQTQSGQVQRGEQISNDCKTATISKIARRQLRDALRVIRRAQAGVRLSYRAGMA